MTPTTRDVHYDQILGNISILYKNANYIGDKIAPVIPVTFRSDHYYVFSKADEFRDTAQYRAPGTSSNRDGFGLSTDSYECKEIAQSTKLEDETRANADAVLRIETAKTRFVTNKIALKNEVLLEALYMTTGNWDNSATPSVLWDDYDDSQPITDFETAIDAVESGHGLTCNTFVLAKNVWKKLKHHPQLIGRLSNDTTRILSLDDLRKLFDIEYIHIGKATKNTAQIGQTASYSAIWSKDVWVGYINQNPGLEEVSASYTYSWDYTNSPGGEPEGAVRGVRRWRDENVHSDIIEAYQSFDHKITASDLGYVIEGAIS
jgi:hypothetical protein